MIYDEYSYHVSFSIFVSRTVPGRAHSRGIQMILFPLLFLVNLVLATSLYLWYSIVFQPHFSARSTSLGRNFFFYYTYCCKKREYKATIECHQLPAIHGTVFYCLFQVGSIPQRFVVFKNAYMHLDLGRERGRHELPIFIK